MGGNMNRKDAENAKGREELTQMNTDEHGGANKATGFPLKSLQGMARRSAADAGLAEQEQEDGAQTFMLRAWQRRGAVTDGGTACAFLATVGDRNMRTDLRREDAKWAHIRQPETAEGLGEFVNWADSGAASPAREAEVADLAARVRREVARLPAGLRFVVERYFFFGLTLGEIALLMTVTESRVCQLKGEAVAALRRRLGVRVSGGNGRSGGNGACGR